MSKRKPEQSFCYAPTGKSGCIFSIRFSWILLPREWRRRKHACVIHISGCICRFALGFCKNIKKRTETLYQSFSPFMVRPTRLELVRVSPHAPQTCAYADSATAACVKHKVYYISFSGLCQPKKNHILFRIVY